MTAVKHVVFCYIPRSQCFVLFLLDHLSFSFRQTKRYRKSSKMMLPNRRFQRKFPNRNHRQLILLPNRRKIPQNACLDNSAHPVSQKKKVVGSSSTQDLKFHTKSEEGQSAFLWRCYFLLKALRYPVLAEIKSQTLAWRNGRLSPVSTDFDHSCCWKSVEMIESDLSFLLNVFLMLQEDFCVRPIIFLDFCSVRS